MSSSLDHPFLTTAPAEAGTGAFDPVLRSSLAHRHRALDARLEIRDGWLVPAAYPDEAPRLEASVTDVSHVGKLEVFAAGEPEDEGIAECFGVGPGHWVVLCRYAELLALGRRLAGASGAVVDRTSAWCALLLAGPSCDTLLRRVSAVESVPSRGPLGKVPATILRRPTGYWVLFPQEYAQYGWDLAVDAATPLGGGPVGVDAVRADDPLLAALRPVQV
jgi:glycine cleavage system aminomethyltransferase T